MFGTSKSGFTLIEILVAMAIIALVATIVVPNLWRQTAGHGRQQFVRSLNALCALGSQQALVTGKTHKVEFDFQKATVALQAATGQRNEKGEPGYGPVKGAYLKTSFTWAPNLEIKNFIVEGFDEMSKFVSGRTTAAWFFITPGKFAQAVTINLVDTKDTLSRNKPRPLGLVNNPFTAQFKEYDTFQK